MNRIEKYLYKVDSIARNLKTGGNFLEIRDSLELDLISESYKQRVISNLVNVRDIVEENFNINNMTEGDSEKEYRVITGAYKDYEDDESFLTEESAKEYYIKQYKENHRIVKNRDEHLEEDYYSIIDKDEEVVEDFYDVDEEEIQERFDELAEEYADEKFDELDFEYDEVEWNTVYKFGRGDIDIDIANGCGLGVLEMNETGEQWLFLTGAGMDMTYQLIRYMALRYGAVTEEYADKLSEVKNMYSKQTYEKILKKLEVDLERLGRG